MTAVMNGTAIERFWARVNRTDSCWLWTGTRNGNGYGIFTFDNRRSVVHRFSYREFVGELVAGMEVDHICRVRHCVNPDHLRVTTSGQNHQNISPIGRGRSGYRGVIYKRGRWIARVKVAGVQHEVWSFADVEEARQVAVALRNQLMTHNTADRVSA